MADKKISELTEKTTPVGTDLVEIVDDPEGTPTNKKTKIRDLVAKTLGVNSQADNYTLVLSDAGKAVVITNSSAKTLTVPKNSSVAFPVGTKIAVFQGGAGTITIEPVDIDVTLKSFDDALDLAGEDAGCVLIKIDTDIWRVEGNLKAS